MTNLELLHNVVTHYLKNNFRALKVESELKVMYMIENALRVSLGKSYDHTEYCLWLADHGPNYGVLVENFAALKALRAAKRVGKFRHSNITSQVQFKVSALDVDSQVLVLLNASNFSIHRLKKIMRSWVSNKPVIFIG